MSYGPDPHIYRINLPEYSIDQFDNFIDFISEHFIIVGKFKLFQNKPLTGLTNQRKPAIVEYLRSMYYEDKVKLVNYYNEYAREPLKIEKKIRLYGDQYRTTSKVNEGKVNKYHSFRNTLAIQIELAIQTLDRTQEVDRDQMNVLQDIAEQEAQKAQKTVGDLVADTELIVIDGIALTEEEQKLKDEGLASASTVEENVEEVAKVLNQAVDAGVVNPNQIQESIQELENAQNNIKNENNRVDTDNIRVNQITERLKEINDKIYEITQQIIQYERSDVEKYQTVLQESYKKLKELEDEGRRLYDERITLQNIPNYESPIESITKAIQYALDKLKQQKENKERILVDVIETPSHNLIAMTETGGYGGRLIVTRPSDIDNKGIDNKRDKYIEKLSGLLDKITSGIGKVGRAGMTVGGAAVQAGGNVLEVVLDYPIPLLAIPVISLVYIYNLWNFISLTITKIVEDVNFFFFTNVIDTIPKTITTLPAFPGLGGGGGGGDDDGDDFGKGPNKIGDIFRRNNDLIKMNKVLLSYSDYIYNLLGYIPYAFWGSLYGFFLYLFYVAGYFTYYYFYWILGGIVIISGGYLYYKYQ